MTTPSRSYQRATSGVLAAESAAERARRNGISPALATSKEARAAVPAPAAPSPLKGAVKVGAFPQRALYPFREIADDGGIWKMDPGAYLWRGRPVKVSGLRGSAAKWATENGYKAKTVIDGGFLYVQFTKAAAS